MPRISLAVSLIAGCHDGLWKLQVRSGAGLEQCSVQSKQERAKEWALVDDTDGPDGLVCDDNVLASVALEDVGDGRELPLAHIHSLPPHRQQPQPLQAR